MTRAMVGMYRSGDLTSSRGVIILSSLMPRSHSCADGGSSEMARRSKRGGGRAAKVHMHGCAVGPSLLCEWLCAETLTFCRNGNRRSRSFRATYRLSTCDKQTNTQAYADAVTHAQLQTHTRTSTHHRGWALIEKENGKGRVWEDKKAKGNRTSK